MKELTFEQVVEEIKGKKILVANRGITALFIGPETEAMRLLGNKVAVRKLARELNVPIVPGSDGDVNIEEAREIIKDIGLPVMLKAEGGGGRGIYEILNHDQLESAFEKATAMAHATFGNPH